VFLVFCRDIYPHESSPKRKSRQLERGRFFLAQDDFFDHYEKGLRRLVSNFRTQAEQHKASADGARGELADAQQLLYDLLTKFDQVRRWLKLRSRETCASSFLWFFFVLLSDEFRFVLCTRFFTQDFDNSKVTAKCVVRSWKTKTTEIQNHGHAVQRQSAGLAFSLFSRFYRSVRCPPTQRFLEFSVRRGVDAWCVVA